VGCVAIVGETYKFVEVNSFEEDEPLLEKEKYCHNHFKANPIKPDITPTFCKDAKLEVTSFDPLTNKPVDITQSIVSLETDVGWKVVANEAGNGSTQSIPLSEDGDYTVRLEAGKIRRRGEINVKCEKCNECKPKLGVAMLDKTAMEKSLLYLTWQSDFALDLIVVEQTFDAKYEKYDAINCKSEKCEKVRMVTDAQEGFTGGDAATIENAMDKKYLVYVDIGEKKTQEAIKQSGARVTFYVKEDSNEITQKLDAGQYEGQRYWVVGCIGSGKNDDFYFLTPHSDFFDKDPINELKNDYCFKNAPKKKV
jgi:hypothetical protein